jgi:hypothetical protein
MNALARPARSACSAASTRGEAATISKARHGESATHELAVGLDDFDDTYGR